MKSTRIVTRRSFSKGTLQGVGALIGLGIWSKSEATSYNNTTPTVAACADAINSICAAKFPTAGVSRTRCEGNLQGAFAAGRQGNWTYPWINSGGGSSSYNTSTNCNTQMDFAGSLYSLGATQVDSLQNNCCHAES